MDFDYPASAEETRAEIRSWLDEHLPDDWQGIGALEGEQYEKFLNDWRAKLYEGGWLGMSWPTQYGGGGRSHLDELVVAEELARVGAPFGGHNDVFGIGMLGNTLLMWGTEEQKQYFLPRALSGEHLWCQGYSEPNAGSDLANVGTRAVLDGDEWVVNGQKIWTSAGQWANWIFVLARTDTEAPKHRGITFLLVPMDQPGVEVRPIKMMSGPSHFNETFFADARTAKDNVVGRVNDGWRVAMTLLGFERGRDAATGPIGFQSEIDRLFDLARERGAADDPATREELVKAWERVQVMKYMGYQRLTSFMNGEDPGPKGAIDKLYWSDYHRDVTELAMDVLGMDGLTLEGREPSTAFRHDEKGAPNSTASWGIVFQNARAGTIYAGTNQIQRNIIGEMLLGLPKEPAPPKG
ncbi:MAG: acyl-CoA dehydrogenase family protein [Acidimicrobiia bacterium]